MLSVCLIFLYILGSSYLAGFLVLLGIRHILGKKEKRVFWPDSYVMAGLIVWNVYAQLFSLFYKVGLLANLIVLGICILTAAAFRHELGEELGEQLGRITKGEKLFYLFLFLLFAYGTSRGIIHYDTGLYHAQSIRWIEEYGVVKGLGNLHCRLAYNSSSFSLSALYSFAFLGGQSYHCVAGFFALLLAKVCSEISLAWKRKGLILADIARLMGFYYLMIIFDEMISPASDYFTVLTVFYIVIRYLDLVEQGEADWLPYSLLALVCVYTMSLKLSAALIVLLALKPAAMLIKEKNWKGIAVFICLGAMVLLPYLIRNVLISGWLVYPFTWVDFFQVDWKIPKGLADYDAREIQVWGRGVYDVARYGEPIGVWLKGWFLSQTAFDKLFILAGIAAVPVSAIAWFVAGIKKADRQRDGMLAAVTVNLSFLFWLFSAPLIRYGCVYVWLAAPVTFGGLAIWLIGKKNAGKYFWRAAYGLLAVVGCYKIFAFGREIVLGFSPDYFIYQKEYENFETEDYEVEGVTFYYPVEGDRVGYDAFPSSPGRAEIQLRGTALEDGFRYKEMR